MNMKNLTLGLTQAQAGASIQDAISGPITKEMRDSAPVITQEEIDANPALSATAFVLWADGPLPEGVTLPEGADTKRIMVRPDQTVIGFQTEEEAVSFLDSEEGMQVVEQVGQAGGTSVGIRALNGGGIPLWDMAMYDIEANKEDTQ